VAPYLKCASCESEHPVYSIIIRLTLSGQRIPLCYDCYERQTGGEYCGEDEYWGGYGWIPLSKGE
jgi:hypothetical protein